MTHNLDSGRFKIISLTEGNPPLGVNHFKLPFQFVHVKAPVHDWMLHKVGNHTYRLSVGPYPHTGVLDGKVNASTHPEHEVEWEITHQEYQNAYTIALARKPHLGWTVPTTLEGSHDVEIKPISSTHSMPPHFLPPQLFRFVPAHDE